jgi:hypothetical protein
VFFVSEEIVLLFTSKGSSSNNVYMYEVGIRDQDSALAMEISNVWMATVDSNEEWEAPSTIPYIEDDEFSGYVRLMISCVLFSFSSLLGLLVS